MLLTFSFRAAYSLLSERCRVWPENAQRDFASCAISSNSTKLDSGRRELYRDTSVVALAPQAFDLLDYLIRNRERVVSKDELITAIWKGRRVSDAALTTRLNAARSAIGDSGENQRLIKTLQRKGYRFIGTVQEARSAPTVAVPDSQGAAAKPDLPLPDKPSLAVLPELQSRAGVFRRRRGRGHRHRPFTLQIAVRHRATIHFYLQRQGYRH
ncbi:transcriptional regulator [Bradyrhizobium sp. CIR18]|uniref:winged helix-turn-helix domain-containing protein n=1 Tax=Bradyrhizobium sp. CIR18 TaxID=2663839 RepID=UPI0028A1B9AD|nr:transcriptional regulator [Bradyrhizobium sp. CIR18]